MHASLLYGLLFGIPQLPDLFDLEIEGGGTENDLSISVEVFSTADLKDLQAVIAPPDAGPAPTTDSTGGKIAPLVLSGPQQPDDDRDGQLSSAGTGSTKTPDSSVKESGVSTARVPAGELDLDNSLDRQRLRSKPSVIEPVRAASKTPLDEPDVNKPVNDASLKTRSERSSVSSPVTEPAKRLREAKEKPAPDGDERRSVPEERENPQNSVAASLRQSEDTPPRQVATTVTDPKAPRTGADAEAVENRRQAARRTDPVKPRKRNVISRPADARQLATSPAPETRALEQTRRRVAAPPPSPQGLEPRIPGGEQTTGTVQPPSRQPPQPNKPPETGGRQMAANAGATAPENSRQPEGGPRTSEAAQVSQQRSASTEASEERDTAIADRERTEAFTGDALPASDAITRVGQTSPPTTIDPSPDGVRTQRPEGSETALLNPVADPAQSLRADQSSQQSTVARSADRRAEERSEQPVVAQAKPAGIAPPSSALRKPQSTDRRQVRRKRETRSERPPASGNPPDQPQTSSANRPSAPSSSRAGKLVRETETAAIDREATRSQPAAPARRAKDPREGAPARATERPQEEPVEENEFLRAVSGKKRDLVEKLLEADPRLRNTVAAPKSEQNITERARVRTMERLQDAAEAGFAHAQYNLAARYLRGEHVEKDIDEAQKWVNQAAEQGYPPAQVLLGLMRFTGVGLPQDLAETAFWWSLAAKRGQESAALASELAKPLLKPREIVKAGRLKSQWGRLISDISEPESEDSAGGNVNEELQNAAAQGDIGVVLALLARGADADSAGEKGRNAVINAAWRGRGKIIDILLRRGADTENADINGRTPLIWSAINGHEEVAAALIASGANPNHADDDGTTALIRAAWNGHTQVVRDLVAAGADVNARDEDGESALSRARGEGHSEIIELLRSSGAR